MEYIIYSDESDQRGDYFSNFYGGVLVRSTHREQLEQRLLDLKQTLHLHGEVKWSKVTAQYLEKYMTLMSEFFKWVSHDDIKVRIMFTNNTYIPRNLEPKQREHEYFLLYYQFIKHAFGLQFSNPSKAPIGIRLYFDRLPDTREKAARFKGFIEGLTQSPEFRRAGIRIRRDQIAEVSSHDHVLLQCLDVVLGAMQFRLNNKHRIKPPGSYRRGKRTIAKERLYKHINKLVQRCYPNFNIGITTGVRGDRTNRWRDVYRHWLFIPRDCDRDMSRAKP